MMVTISIVMAVYNAEKYLRESMQSILDQEYQDYEFIIINDGSTDKSEAIIKSFSDPRIKYYTQDNCGLASSLNRGIGLSSGRYIARMDADDISMPERLKKQAGFLDENEDVVLVGTWAARINESGSLLDTLKPYTTHKQIRRHILNDNEFIHPSVCFRRESFDALGGYDTQYRYAQDYDLFLRMSENGFVANIPEVLVKYRFYTGNYTKKKRVLQERTSLKIRFRAFLRGSYPVWMIAYLFLKIGNYLIPFELKKVYWKIRFRTN
jgi:glycosyltransferase involved in cell wall biosynthesis